MIRILRFIGIIFILYASWLMIALSLPYTTFDPYVDFLYTKQLVYHIHHWRISFYIHVFVSTIVLIAGVLQFIPYILRKKVRLHRTSGFVYAFIVIVLSGPSGLVMGYYANGGIAAQISFMLLAALWIFFTLMAMLKIWKRDWRGHADFMVRSYALTLSAVTLRLLTYLMAVFQMEIPPRTAYIVIAWLSWTVNLLIAEWIIHRKLVVLPVHR